MEKNNASDVGLQALDAEGVNWLDEVFRYHPQERDQMERYVAVRNAGREMAACILLNCPDSSDRAAALRKIREAVMTANASIALRGRV